MKKSQKSFVIVNRTYMVYNNGLRVGDMALSSLLEIILTIENTNRYISKISFSLLCQNKKLSILNSTFFSSEFYDAYPEISQEDIALLNYWNTIENPSKDEQHIVFSNFFPVELLFFMKSVKNIVIFSDGSSSNLKFSEEIYTPEIYFDAADAKLTISNDDESFLLPSSIPMVLHDQKIKSIKSILNNKILETIYRENSVKISPSESHFLIENLEKSSSLAKMLSTPHLIQATIIQPVIDFSIEAKNNKYLLELFLDATDTDGKSYRFPLNIEKTRDHLKSSEKFCINGPNNLSLIIDPNASIHNKLTKIIKHCFQNFYSLLNEIQENKIISDDRNNIFEHFLPNIAEDIEIYHGSKKNKQKFFLAQETPEITVEEKNIPMFNNIDWLSISFQYDNKKISLSLKELAEIIDLGFLQKNGILISLPEKDLDPIKKLLSFQTKKAKKEHIEAWFLPWILSSYENTKVPAKWADLATFLKTGNPPEITLSENTEITLRNYQKSGVKHLALLNKFGFGVILADEMGLGKTLQILSILDMYLLGGTALIVTPSALVLNWIAEINKFYPNRFKVLIAHGLKEKRTEILKNIAEYDIIITSYHTLSIDVDFYSKHAFKYCIIDEAQHIKNRNTQRAQSVKKINANSKIAVSGTPLENNILEFWSIFDFIMPNFLGTAQEFQKKFVKSLENFDQEKRRSTLKDLYQICAPFIIRRTKDKVYKELPPKIEQTIFTELTDQQKSLYLQTLSSVKTQFSVLIEDGRFAKHQIDFLSSLTKLRQIALHPGLIYPELAEKDFNIYASKMVILLELVADSLASNHRILIFSQFVSMLHLIKIELLKESIPFLYLDGKTTNRVELADKFNNGTTPIFLISLRAGGLGLNLTGADTVILFDPWWNPSVENQAIDRIHRIGQKKVVNVYRITTTGTIEEKIYQLQQKKGLLFESLIQENADFTNFSKEDLISLLDINPEIF